MWDHWPFLFCFLHCCCFDWKKRLRAKIILDTTAETNKYEGSLYSIILLVPSVFVTIPDNHHQNMFRTKHKTPTNHIDNPIILSFFFVLFFLFVWHSLSIVASVSRKQKQLKRKKEKTDWQIDQRWGEQEVDCKRTLESSHPICPSCSCWARSSELSKLVVVICWESLLWQTLLLHLVFGGFGFIVWIFWLFWFVFFFFFFFFVMLFEFGKSFGGKRDKRGESWDEQDWNLLSCCLCCCISSNWSAEMVEKEKVSFQLFIFFSTKPKKIVCLFFWRTNFTHKDQAVTTGKIKKQKRIKTQQNFFSKVVMRLTNGQRQFQRDLVVWSEEERRVLTQIAGVCPTQTTTHFINKLAVRAKVTWFPCLFGFFFFFFWEFVVGHKNKNKKKRVNQHTLLFSFFFCFFGVFFVTTFFLLVLFFGCWQKKQQTTTTTNQQQQQQQTNNNNNKKKQVSQVQVSLEATRRELCRVVYSELCFYSEIRPNNSNLIAIGCHHVKLVDYCCRFPSLSLNKVDDDDGLCVCVFVFFFCFFEQST